MSVTKKLVFSLLTVVTFFLVIEGILSVVGVRPIAATNDPYVGFSGKLPLMVSAKDQRGQTILRTAPNKLVLFNDQQFVADKPSNTRRIFCVGGSTTFGRPFSDTTSYCGWLREMLPVVDNKTRWEVINAGGVSYASYRVAAVMEELAQYQPDLFIVYSAHNEFLERRTYADMFDKPQSLLDISATLAHTRTWSALSRLVNHGNPAPKADLLPAEVDEMLNHSIGPESYHRDEAWKQRVLIHYRLNLSRMIEIARGSGADIVFITPASNEKDCSPFKSEFRSALSGERRQAFMRTLNRGIQQSRLGRHSEALESFRNAKLIDDRHADLHYQMGKSLFALDRHEDAKQHLERALNEDICPLRAVKEISQAIRTCAADHGIPVIDFETRLRADCQTNYGHNMLGAECFLDHVHPRRNVHQQLANWIIDGLLATAIIAGKTPTKGDIAAVADRIQAGINPHDHGVAFRNLAKVMHWSGKFAEAQPRAIDALKLLPDDPESLLVLADCLSQTGRTDQALQHYDRLLQIHPLYLRAMLPFAELLISTQQFERAKPLLDAAKGLHELDHPNQIRTDFCLGQVHLGLGQYEQAIAVLQKVHDAYPDESRTLFMLAESKSGAGEDDQAIDLYRQALTLEPYNASAHQRIGLILLKQRQPHEAIKHFDTALKLDPGNAQLRQHLIIARQLIE